MSLSYVRCHQKKCHHCSKPKLIQWGLYCFSSILARKKSGLERWREARILVNSFRRVNTAPYNFSVHMSRLHCLPLSVRSKEHRRLFFFRAELNLWWKQALMTHSIPAQADRIETKAHAASALRSYVSVEKRLHLHI